MERLWRFSSFIIEDSLILRKALSPPEWWCTPILAQNKDDRIV